MKVLFFIRSLVVGGSQRQLVMLADGLARRGHEVVIAVFYTGGEIDVARQQTAARVLPLGKTGRWDAIGPLSRLRRLLLMERPDVVYAFQPTQAALAALLLPRRLPTRLVFGVRAAGMEPDRYDIALGLDLSAGGLAVATRGPRYRERPRRAGRCDQARHGGRADRGRPQRDR